MNQHEPTYDRAAGQIIVIQNSLIRQVYAWMGAGLTITALLALVTVSSRLYSMQSPGTGSYFTVLCSENLVL